MATSYSQIYESFIFKVEGYKLMMLLQEDREDILKLYLNAVCRKIHRKVKNYVDLKNRDNETQEFIDDIDDDMIDIIAECMITEWLRPKIYSDELLESRLNTKDFSEYSPANLIHQIREVFQMSEKASLVAINNYSFSHDDIAELTKT